MFKVNIKIICAQCGNEKYLRSTYYAKDRNFCSPACSAKYNSEAKKVEIICKNCGDIRIVPKWYATQGVIFCSRRCSSAYKSKQNNTNGMLRRCSVCGKEKILNEKNWSITIKNGLIKYKNPCRICINERAKIQRIKHRDKVLARLKKWHQENKEHCREYKREYAVNNPGYHKECYERSKAKPDYIIRKRTSDRKYRKAHREQVNQISRKNKKQNRAKLTDSVIRQYYVELGVNRESITHEMIELKRQQIIMKRTLKEFKQWRKEQENEPNYTNVYGEQHTDEENHEGRV